MIGPHLSGPSGTKLLLLDSNTTTRDLRAKIMRKLRSEERRVRKECRL